MFEFHDFTDTSSNPKICAKTRSTYVCKYIFNHKKCTPIYTWNMIKIGMWHLLYVCRSNNLAHVSMFCPPLTLDPTVSLLGKMNKNIQPFWLSTRYYFFLSQIQNLYLKEVVNKLTFKQVKLVKLTSLLD